MEANLKNKIIKFLYNINSTSFFPKAKDNKSYKVEMAFAIAIITGILASFSIGWESAKDISYGLFSALAVIPFTVFVLQFPVFGKFLSPVSKEIQDHFWKTQMWRFMDKDFDLQKSLYPNADERLKELKQKWEDEHGMSPEDTILNPPFMQNKFRMVITGVLSVVVSGLLGYGLGLLF